MRQTQHEMQELVNEFSEIQRDIFKGLRASTYPDRSGWLHVNCQFVILPSFENALSWDVVSMMPRHEEPVQTRLYRTCWRRDIDEPAFLSMTERARHPRPYVPTLEVGWVWIERTPVEAILKRLTIIAVPLLPASHGGVLDANILELEVDVWSESVRICLRAGLPHEWLPLVPVVNALENAFEEAWAAGTASATEAGDSDNNRS